MADHLKTLDSNHMVTIGEEGYWAINDPLKQYNPGNGWAQITGQNFSAQHAPKSIDFAAIHFWPDLWVSPLSCTLDIVVCLLDHSLLYSRCCPYVMSTTKS